MTLATDYIEKLINKVEQILISFLATDNTDFTDKLFDFCEKF